MLMSSSAHQLACADAMVNMIGLLLEGTQRAQTLFLHPMTVHLMSGRTSICMHPEITSHTMFSGTPLILVVSSMRAAAMTAMASLLSWRKQMW